MTEFPKKENQLKTQPTTICCVLPPDWALNVVSMSNTLYLILAVVKCFLFFSIFFEQMGKKAEHSPGIELCGRMERINSTRRMT